jgi:hypothetical protein
LLFPVHSAASSIHHLPCPIQFLCAYFSVLEARSSLSDSSSGVKLAQLTHVSKTGMGLDWVWGREVQGKGFSYVKLVETRCRLRENLGTLWWHQSADRSSPHLENAMMWLGAPSSAPNQEKIGSLITRKNLRETFQGENAGVGAATISMYPREAPRIIPKEPLLQKAKFHSASTFMKVCT